MFPKHGLNCLRTAREGKFSVRFRGPDAFTPWSGRTFCATHRLSRRTWGLRHSSILLSTGPGRLSSFSISPALELRASFPKAELLEAPCGMASTGSCCPTSLSAGLRQLFVCCNPPQNDSALPPKQAVIAGQLLKNEPLDRRLAGALFSRLTGCGSSARTCPTLGGTIGSVPHYDRPNRGTSRHRLGTQTKFRKGGRSGRPTRAAALAGRGRLSPLRLPAAVRPYAWHGF